MKKLEKNAIFMIIFLILGIAVATQVKTTLAAKKQTELNNPKIEKLKIQLDEAISTGNMYKKSIDENEKKKENFIKVPVNNEQYDSLKKELDYIKFIAGLTDVKGQGVIVTLNDALIPDKSLVDSQNLIHDWIVDSILNNLKNSGVEAISINNERIMSTSEIICVGPTIKINNNRYSVPYEIKAIGNPDILSSELKDYIADSVLKFYNIRIDIKIEKDITIPKYKNNLDELLTGLED
jgi:uncharacterized protein YlxW (UPF0749 family)